MPNDLLNALGIRYQAFEHPPLNDSQAAERLGVKRPGQRIKNLFLRDNYGRRHVLLLVPASKKVDLKALSAASGLSRLGFASAERLQKYLGVKPGAVSLLALVNDSERQVMLWIDQALWQGGDFQCHPLVSTRTWVLAKSDVERFCAHLGVVPAIIEVPGGD